MNQPASSEIPIVAGTTTASTGPEVSSRQFDGRDASASAAAKGTTATITTASSPWCSAPLSARPTEIPDGKTS